MVTRQEVEKLLAPLFKKTITHFNYDDYLRKRDPVVDKLVRMGPDVVEPLCTLLDEGPVQELEIIVLALGKIGDPRAAEALRGQLARDTLRNNDEMISCILVALAQMGEEEAIQQLVARIKGGYRNAISSLFQVDFDIIETYAKDCLMDPLLTYEQHQVLLDFLTINKRKPSDLLPITREKNEHDRVAARFEREKQPHCSSTIKKTAAQTTKRPLSHQQEDYSLRALSKLIQWGKFTISPETIPTVQRIIQHYLADDSLSPQDASHQQVTELIEHMATVDHPTIIDLLRRIANESPIDRVRSAALTALDTLEAGK